MTLTLELLCVFECSFDVKLCEWIYLNSAIFPLPSLFRAVRLLRSSFASTLKVSLTYCLSPWRAMRSFRSLYISSLLLGSAYGQSTTLPPPGQPTQTATVGTFNITGSSLVSAQQVRVLSVIYEPSFMRNFYTRQFFLSKFSKIYFIDKVENNPTQINGHAAWASGAPISVKKIQIFTI